MASKDLLEVGQVMTFCSDLICAPKCIGLLDFVACFNLLLDVIEIERKELGVDLPCAVKALVD